jgi:multidrug efflux pump subunit AcrA (membrane-fusion protein)
MKSKFLIIPILSLLISACSTQTTLTPTPLPPVSGSLAVVADGRLMPAQSLDLSFAAGGQVAQVLVAEGDPVAANQLIAQLKSGQALQAQLKQAAAALATAQNNYQSLKQGATYQSLQAAVATAQMELVTAQQALTDLNDKAAVATAQANQAVAAAQSALTQAKKQVGYAQNPVGHTLTDAVRDAQVALDAAQANAKLATVSQPVQDYTNSYWLTDFYWKRYQDLKAKYDANPNPDALTKMNNAYADWQQLADQQAQRQLTAQTDQSLKNNTVLQAQQAYSDAVRNLNSALAGPDADKLAVAQANQMLAEATLADAQAHAAKLSNGPDPELLAAAQARLNAAQAGLASAQAALAPEQLAAAQAQVDAAQAALASAQAALTDAELRAPFAGTLAHFDLKVGQQLAPGQVVGTLADFSSWRVETKNLTEIEVVRIGVGQAVTVTLDALPDTPLGGHVTAISPVYVEQQGDVTYVTHILLADQQRPMRWGMTASVTFAK